MALWQRRHPETSQEERGAGRQNPLIRGVLEHRFERCKRKQSESSQKELVPNSVTVRSC
jgi:hypothetical protein